MFYCLRSPQPNPEPKQTKLNVSKARDNTLSEVTEIVIEGPKFVGVYIICRLNTIILEKLKNIRQYLRESSCFSSEQYKDNVDYTKVLVGTAHTEQKEKEKVVLL